MTTRLPAGDPAALLAAGERGKKKLAALRASASEAPLTPAERAELQRVCEAELPRFAGRVAGAAASVVGAPFFGRVRILHLLSHVPFPAQEAYAAWPSSGPVMLSGNPSAFAAVCADEPPKHADDPDLAVLLAIFAGIWSSASLHKEVRLATLDDVPWRRASPLDLSAEDAIRAAYASQIAPAGLTRLDDGVRVTMWVASESRLRHRIAEVRRTSVTVTETVLAELPVFPGRMWGLRDGRLVPIG